PRAAAITAHGAPPSPLSCVAMARSAALRCLAKIWNPSHRCRKITAKARKIWYRNRHSILERGVQMKKLFLGSVALVALGLGATAAFAAEKRVPAPAYTPPPPPAPVYTWSGCYAGASAGSSSGTSQHFTTAGSILTGAVPQPVAGGNITDSFNLSGFIGGGQLGCHWQWGAWGFCLEGDRSAAHQESQAFECTPTSGAR